MPRYALGIEYDGSDYLGWQRQHQGPTVQATLEPALSFVANEMVEVICAGRTDTGVHARGQVVHFDCAAERGERAWVLGSNSRLPASVALTWARPVSDDFHARYSARLRSYCFRILRRPSRPALDARYALWVREPLDVAAMSTAAQLLVGQHDFTSFRTLACQANSPVRHIHRIDIREHGPWLELEFEANAFLHHMIRNIVGSLLVVGRGEQAPAWVGAVLALRDRSKAGPTAPPQGLTFLCARYPASFGLPLEHCLP
jgi:tRNA pseudouridine38-40 synthase